MGEAWKPREDSPEEENQITEAFLFATVFQFLSRRIDLMEKYEAAQREYIDAPERRAADLEKELPKLKSNLVRYDQAPQVSRRTQGRGGGQKIRTPGSSWRGGKEGDPLAESAHVGRIDCHGRRQKRIGSQGS